MIELNVPLLRKAVEWVEEQATLPETTRQWYQLSWVTLEDQRVGELEHEAGCGTAYCLAGWVAAQKYPELAHVSSAMINDERVTTEFVATRELGLPRPGQAPEQYVPEGIHCLFSPNNTAEDIRRIAEWIAGEKL